MFDAIMAVLSDWMLILALHLSSSSFPPVLSAHDERECFERARAGDSAARDKLINHNLRLVAHITKKYYAGVVDQDDLISIGTIGLIKAVNSFQYSKNVRFATYAARCIENEVLMMFRSTQKEQKNVSISDPLESDGDGNSLTVADTLFENADICGGIERRESAAALHRAVAQLPPRERKILELRYGLSKNAPLTQNEVAGMLKISRSYVSRIEKRALEMLREEFERKEK